MATNPGLVRVFFAMTRWGVRSAPAAEVAGRQVYAEEIAKRHGLACFAAPQTDLRGYPKTLVSIPRIVAKAILLL